MATLNVTSNFTLFSQGLYTIGKQGPASGAITDPIDLNTLLTLAGTTHVVQGLLPTATAVTVYDDDDDKPVDFNYLFVWADQDLYIQIIGATGNAVIKQTAKVPFVLCHPGTAAGLQCGIIAVANTTPITGGSEPTLTDIDSVVLGNYSGTSANYFFAVID